jgi:hypothetical protein
MGGAIVEKEGSWAMVTVIDASLDESRYDDRIEP